MDERRLWAGVLIQAVKDLAGYTLVPKKRERARVQNFARVWFTSNNCNVGSFRWICDELGLEPSWIRRRMRVRIDSDPQTAKDLKRSRIDRALAALEEAVSRCRAEDVRYGLGVSAALSFLERHADEQWPFEQFRGALADRSRDERNKAGSPLATA